MSEINCMEDLQRAVRDGRTDFTEYGDVYTKQWDGLLLLDYSARAQFAGRWNWLETNARGLILDRVTGEVVARPYEKFFNWGENGRTSSSPIRSITEKLDGSLGILYRHRANYRIATRGAFTSEQANWATVFLHKYHDLTGLSDELTLLFEIIYPGNRVVVDYGAREALVLLAARNRFTGEYLPFLSDVFDLATHYGFDTPHVHTFRTPADILQAAATLDGNSEGWVVEFADGQRFKFKGERYRELHRLLSDLSFKNTLKAIADGVFDEWVATIPDEFLAPVRQWAAYIHAEVVNTQTMIQQAFDQRPHGGTRKDFALWVQQQPSRLHPYLFALYDGRDPLPLIYKQGIEEMIDV